MSKKFESNSAVTPSASDPDEEYFPSDFSRRQTLDMLAGGALMTALPSLLPGLSSTAHAAEDDDVVRIGFRDRTAEKIRHVWLLINGFTYESTTKRRRNGPTCFRWDVRSEEASNCFVLGNAPNLLWTELMGTANFS